MSADSGSSDDEYMVTMTTGGNRIILRRMPIDQAAASRDTGQEPASAVVSEAGEVHRDAGEAVPAQSENTINVCFPGESLCICGALFTRRVWGSVSFRLACNFFCEFLKTVAKKTSCSFLFSICCVRPSAHLSTIPMPTLCPWNPLFRLHCHRLKKWVKKAAGTEGKMFSSEEFGSREQGGKGIKA